MSEKNYWKLSLKELFFITAAQITCDHIESRFLLKGNVL